MDSESWLDQVFDELAQCAQIHVDPQELGYGLDPRGERVPLPDIPVPEALFSPDALYLFERYRLVPNAQGKVIQRLPLGETWDALDGAGSRGFTGVLREAVRLAQNVCWIGPWHAVGRWMATIAQQTAGAAQIQTEDAPWLGELPTLASATHARLAGTPLVLEASGVFAHASHCLCETHGLHVWWPGRSVARAYGLMNHWLDTSSSYVPGADLMVVVNAAGRVTDVAQISQDHPAGFYPCFETKTVAGVSGLAPVYRPMFLGDVDDGLPWATMRAVLTSEPVTTVADHEVTRSPSKAAEPETATQSAPTPRTRRMVSAPTAPEPASLGRPSAAEVSDADELDPGWELEEIETPEAEPVGEMTSEDASMAAAYGLGPPPAPASVAPEEVIQFQATMKEVGSRNAKAPSSDTPGEPDQEE